MGHKREHRSVLAEGERRVLIAIARRVPARINSDHLTCLGVAAMTSAGLAFAMIPAAGWRAAAAFVVALAANWLGDSLDGTLARVRHQQRPRYGYYVDHLIDLVGTSALFAGIGASGLMHPSLALALVAAYFLVAAESYLATHACGIFRISFAGFGPTELRIILAVGALVVVNRPWVDVLGLHARLFDVGGAVAIVGLVGAFVVSAVRNTRALYEAEPLPDRRAAKAQAPKTHVPNPGPTTNEVFPLCP